MNRKWILAVGVAVAVVLAASPITAAPGGPPPGLARAVAAQEANSARLLTTPGVVGTAVGAGPAGGAAVLVLTEGPDVAGIPTTVDGVPTVVLVTGRIEAQAKPSVKPDKPGKPAPEPDDPAGIDPTGRFDRPVPIGVSTGPAFADSGVIWAGTYGARVTDGTGVFALSNNHVFSGGNVVPAGTAILQPGLLDGGVPGADAIGTLVDWEPIRFDGSANTIDAAIALSDATLIGNATPADGYGTPGGTAVDAELGQPVQKYGRTTALTTGKVTGINAMVQVTYSQGTALFVDQIVITGSRGAFSKAGDSGSLVVTADGSNSPVGLLFAGGKRTTIANPIGAVLARFGVTVDSP